MSLQEMTYEERYSQADRDEAERQGKTVDEMFRESGASMDVDGRWYITGRQGQGADEIRATYREISGSDGDGEFSTEDVRSIELGDRVVEDLMGENGDTPEDGKAASGPPRELLRSGLRAWRARARPRRPCGGSGRRMSG